MKKVYLYLLSLTFAVFTAHALANSSEIKSLQIGFCDNCNESELKSLAKSWAKPLSKTVASACDKSVSTSNCAENNLALATETTIVYLLDSVKESRNKFEVVMQYNKPTLVNRVEILPEEHTMMRDLEIHRSEYRAGLQALAERGQSFIPDELAQSNVDNNLSFLRNKSNDSFSTAASKSSNSTLQADNAVTTSVDCNAPGNTSMFYNLFLEDRRKLREIEKKAENLLNQNYPKGASYSFGGSLDTSGVINAAIGTNAQTHAKYKNETMKELKNWRLALDDGKQGSLFFKVLTQGIPSGVVSYVLKFNEENSYDAQGYTISERKDYLRRTGRTRVENPCDAQAMAKLIAENSEFKTGNTGGGPVSGDAFGQSKPWGYDNACNTPRVSNKENVEYIYNLALEPSGEIEIRVHRGNEITAETIVETIKCI